jgi:sorbitol-specific phosphotransferase system component IIC
MKLFGALLVIAMVIAGTVYFGRTIREPLTASVLDGVVPSHTPLVALETVYPEPESVVWEGVIEGVLAGGQGLAVRGDAVLGMFQAYFASGVTSSITEGPVRIAGRLTGISCAYAQTVFGGQCTPSVDIESIEQLAIELQ